MPLPMSAGEQAERGFISKGSAFFGGWNKGDGLYQLLQAFEKSKKHLPVGFIQRFEMVFAFSRLSSMPQNGLR